MKITNIIYLILITLSMFSCRKDFEDLVILDKDPPDTVVYVETTVYGRIVDDNNNPVVKAKVFLHKEAVWSDDNGIFIFPSIISLEKLGVIDVFHPNFISGHFIINSFVGDTLVTYLRLQENSQEGTFNSNNPLSIINFDNFSIDFSSTKFINQASEFYHGDLIYKGNSWSINNQAQNSDNQHDIGHIDSHDVLLQAIGGFNFSLSDNRKVIDLNTLDDQRATWKIPTHLLNIVSEQILLWNYDNEAQRWKKITMATRVGDVFEFNISETGQFLLADFNEMKTITGTIVGHDQNELSELELNFVYGNYKSIKKIKTSANGQFLVHLPINNDINLVFRTFCSDIIDEIDLGQIEDDLKWNTPFEINDLATSISLRGSVVDCQNLPQEHSYISFSGDSWKERILLCNKLGQYHTTLQTCDDNSIKIIGIDYLNGTQGIPMTYQLDRDIDKGFVRSCYDEWESAFMIFHDAEVYNFENCELIQNDYRGNILESYHFVARSNNLGIIDHTLQKIPNANVGYWTTLENQDSYIEILEIKSTPYIREIVDARGNTWIEFEVSNVVAIRHDANMDEKLNNARIYYFAKKD